MLKEKMECVQNAGMKCADLSQANAARFYGHNYQMMFLDAWSFKFGKNIYENEHLLAERLSPGDNRVKENMLKYHGIDSNVSEFSSSLECKDYIISCVKHKTPVSMHFDQWYMPWAPEKRRSEALRYDGYLLFLEYDDIRDIFSCVDVHGSRSVEILPGDNFIKACTNSRNIKEVTAHSLAGEEKQVDVKTEICNILSKVWKRNEEGKTFFDEMSECARFVADNFNFAEEIDITERTYGRIIVPERIMCVSQMVDIARMRNLFSVTLEYLNSLDHEIDLRDISNEFKLIYSSWKLLISTLYKRYYKKDYEGLDSLISEKISEYCEMEKKIAGKFEKLVHEPPKRAVLPETEKMLQKGVYDKVYVDLGKYKDNRGFSMEKYGGQADFDGLNNYFIYDDSIQNILPELKNELQNGRNDNIVCQGQKIVFESCVCKKVSLFASSESGSFIGKFSVLSDDIVVRNECLGFGEWRFSKCEWNDKCVWEGDRMYMGRISDEEKSHIFEQQIEFSEKTEINGLLLPECPGIHVFGIILYVSPSE